MPDKYDDFIDWVNSELEKQNWSQADLARHSGLTKGGINGMMNKKQIRPGYDICMGIAKAFGISEIFVLRKAGLLPEGPGDDVEYEEFHDLFSKVPDDRKEEVKGILRVIVSQTREKGGNDVKIPSEETSPRNIY